MIDGGLRIEEYPQHLGVRTANEACAIRNDGLPTVGRSTWIVVPAYNESRRLAGALSGLREFGYDNVVVVDDGSQDDTLDIASRHSVWILCHPFNCGQGAAIRTGIEFALSRGADYLVTFDADGQHQPGDIVKLLEPLENGHADVVLGSRFLGAAEAIPPVRRLLLKAAVLFTRATCGLKVTDAHNGLRAFSRKAVESIQIEQPRMAHASEILHHVSKQRLPYQEVPVTIRYTAETLAKGQSSWDAIRIASQLLLGRFVK